MITRLVPALMLVAAACGQASDVAPVAPGTSPAAPPATTGITPSTPPSNALEVTTVLNAGAPDASAGLVDRVAWAESVLTQDTRTRVAATIVYNRDLHGRMTQCMADAGFPYAAFGEPIVNLANIDINTTKAAWFRKPRPDRAAVGLGIVSNPVDQALSMPTETPDPTVRFTADELASYEAASRSCHDQNAQQPDPTTLERLISEMDSIEKVAKSRPGFKELDQMYRACVRKAGGTFGQPDEIDQLVRSDPAPTNELEIEAASIDAACRVDTHTEFISLTASEWDSWLTKSDADLRSLAATWADLRTRAGL